MQKNRTKGYYKTQHKRLIKIFNAMKQRCSNPKDTRYKNYGARGITICDEWLNDSKKFYDWANNNGYNDNLSIDRIDVKGNYEPLNCRWVTQVEQQNNKRNNHFIEFNGKRKTIAQWARYYGITWYQASKLEKM